jgi:hypothetical protein
MPGHFRLPSKADASGHCRFALLRSWPGSSSARIPPACPGPSASTARGGSRIGSDRNPALAQRPLPARLGGPGASGEPVRPCNQQHVSARQRCWSLRQGGTISLRPLCFSLNTFSVPAAFSAANAPKVLTILACLPRSSLAQARSVIPRLATRFPSTSRTAKHLAACRT